MAEVLGGRGPDSIPSHLAIFAVLDEFAREFLPASHYSQTNHFARYLLGFYPEDAPVAMLTTERSDDFNSVHVRFEDQGIDLHDAIARYEELIDTCSFKNPWVGLAECSVRPTPWLADGAWSSTGRLNCTDAETPGPGPGGYMWTVRTFDIVEEFNYTLRLDGANAIIAYLGACDVEFCSQRGVVDSGLNRSGIMRANSAPEIYTHLTPGRYWLRVARPVED